MRKFAFAIVLILISCQNNKTEQAISLQDLTPVVLETKGNEIFQYWEFENNPSYWENNLGSVLSLKSYRDSLEMVLGKDFQQAVQKEASQANTLDTVGVQNGDLINAQLVHSGSIGTIRPMRFLEAELLNYQLTRYPLLSHPTEFHGCILLNDSIKRVRVYFASSDQPWPPKPRIILESIKQDLNQGWHFKYHMHNHYEPKSNHYAGILAPSLADAQFFVFLSEDYNLGGALITNGFHTLEVKNSEFSKFKSHQD